MATLSVAADWGQIRFAGDALALRWQNTPLTIPLNPDAWFTALCRAQARDNTDAERAILRNVGADTEPPCAGSP
jgi:hypothetical protein